MTPIRVKLKPGCSLPTPPVQLGHPTGERVRAAVEELRAALKAQYGCDYSLSVSGAGNLLGASTMRYGEVVATVGEMKDKNQD